MNRLLHRTGIAPLLGALLALTALVYGQGLSGPFLFDDTTNILKNTPLQVESLAPAELWRAARSP
jgi:hypothetical protein